MVVDESPALRTMGGAEVKSWSSDSKRYVTNDDSKGRCSKAI